MGKTIVTAKLTNFSDQELARRGFIPESEIRSLEVEGIVDTGAVLVSLPEPIVEQLGLSISEHRRVRYADGRSGERPIASGLFIEIQGRTALCRVIVNPTKSTVLIGQIPLEEMDWLVDPRNQCLVTGHPDFPEGLIEMY